MPFEVFNKRRAGKTTIPIVGLQKRGTFSFNQAAIRGLGGFSAEEELPEKITVEMLFDREGLRVGFRRAEPSSTSYAIRRQPKSVSYLLSGRAFTQYYGIRTKDQRSYQADIHENIVSIQLSDSDMIPSDERVVEVGEEGED